MVAMTKHIDLHDFCEKYKGDADLFDGPYPHSVIFVPATYTMSSGRTRRAFFEGKVYVCRYDDVVEYIITIDGNENVTNIAVGMNLEKIGIVLQTVQNFRGIIIPPDVPMPSMPNYASWDDPDALPF